MQIIRKFLKLGKGGFDIGTLSCISGFTSGSHGKPRSKWNLISTILKMLTV